MLPVHCPSKPAQRFIIREILYILLIFVLIILGIIAIITAIGCILFVIGYIGKPLFELIFREDTIIREGWYYIINTILIGFTVLYILTVFVLIIGLVLFGYIGLISLDYNSWSYDNRTNPKLAQNPKNILYYICRLIAIHIITVVTITVHTKISLAHPYFKVGDKGIIIPEPARWILSVCIQLIVGLVLFGIIAGIYQYYINACERYRLQIEEYEAKEL